MDELSKLKEENKKLKSILKQLGYIFIDENLILNKEQRMNIFMNYFKGRNDIYALKYFNKKKNKYQYSPVCINKFNKKLCLLTKNKKCSECLHNQYQTLTPEIILKHMQKPNKSIGIYPLLEDNTCYFLVIDFDDDFWFENLLSVYRVAKKYSISCIMERSQSGNGGHLWIFFETAIKASKARGLGDFLLEEAMKSNKQLSFSSFDRLFPSQDYHSGKGFGNCIALPLQFEAIHHGNSLFINEFQEPIHKPFHYLMATAKVKEEHINQIIQNQTTHFKDYFEISDSLLKTDQIQESIIIQENSMLCINKKGLNANTLLTLRKISTIYNPEFYKNINLHLSVFGVPRTLCENIENDKEILIPRGLKNTLFKYINSELVNYVDKTFEGQNIDISFKGALKPNQQIAADTLLQHEIAMIEAIPGFGKTVIALYLMAALKKSTLIIVNSKELLQQWLDKIDEFIDYPSALKKKDHYIGEYHGNKKKLKGRIDVALIQSLSHLEDISIIQKYGLVLIDECHHASSNVYRNVLRNINAKYIFSFSATPKRRDQLDKIFYMYLGNIVYKSDKQEIIKNRNYEQILLPRITTFKIIDTTINYTEICNELYQNEKRNYLIVQDVNTEIKNKKNIILLTDRKEHIQILYNQLKYNEYDIFCMSGDNSIRERKIIKEKICSSKHYLIIATSQLIGEGFDLPSLNTMFITMPISFQGRLTQYIGRLHRDYENKTQIKVYDYVDVHIPQLQRMFQKRLKVYKSEGYKVIENNETIEFDHVIYDKANYEYYLNASMNQANKNIILFANECKINRIQRIYSFLISLYAKGIKIYICTNKSFDDNTTHYLEGISTRILESNISINAILIDEKELWTSSSSYLGIQNNDLFYLKTKDITIIEELKGHINLI